MKMCAFGFINFSKTGHTTVDIWRQIANIFKFSKKAQNFLYATYLVTFVFTFLFTSFSAF